jgi:hypothetical protein
VLLAAGVLSVVALLSIVYCCLGALAWWLFWIFLALVCAFAKKIQICHQMRWRFLYLFPFALL